MSKVRNCKNVINKINEKNKIKKKTSKMGIKSYY